MSDRLLTIIEVAEQLKVHWQTVRTYIQNGKLKGVRVGRRVRITEADLQSFLKNEKPKSENLEIEIRFITQKRRLVEENLIKMGGKVIYQGHVIDHWFVPNEIKNMEEKNEWFDNAVGYGLRVREQDNGYTGKITATLEVKRLKIPGEHNTCIEGEMAVSAYDEARNLLSLMNMKEMIALDKDRLVYKLGDFKVVIDDIKNFKTGIEIESVTDEDRTIVLPRLKELASKLGLNWEEEATNRSATYLYMVEFARF